MSQVDDFIDTPMGPGLTGDNPPGQSVHPQAGASTSAPTPTGKAVPKDRTKAAPGEKLGSEIAAARIDLGDAERGDSAPGEAGGSVDNTGGL